MSKAHIVGSMQLPDDDSDSSESEEEVELFEKPIVPEDTEKEPLAFEVSLPAAKIKPNGLLGAMTAALADIEGSRNESGNTADQNTEPEATPEPLPDAFGIVYKPLKKKTENQNVKAMSFEDEKEFERELQLANFGIGSSGAATSANNHNEEDDDDEFAIDATATDAPELSHILSRVASQQQQTETIAAAESVPVPVNDFNNQVWAASTSSATAVSEEEVSGASFLRNSRSALADIKSAYSEGRGDVEVRLLNDDRSNNSASNGNGVTATEVIPLHQLKDITVIEEGDEDEEEEEEEREELQKAAEARQEEELAVQWSSIGHESNEGEGQDEVGEVPSAMEMEFDAVAAGMNAGSGAGNGASAPAPAASTPTALSPVSYQECLLHLTGTSNLSQYEPLITVEDSGTTDQKGGLGGLGGLLFGSGNARLAFGSSAELTKEAQKLPFLLAQVDYTPSDSVHYRVLCTIYQSLCQYKNSSSSSISQQLVPPPASTSSLWEDIGFQGQDPRTDLNRAMKMLAVLQMLHFLESYPALARQCHVISESYIPNRTASTASLRADPTKDVSWPFMCVSIMFTKEALQAFRSGFLNAKCNKHGTILEILHDFHHALFQQFYSLLLVGNKQTPIVHHAEHLAALRKQCAKSPLVVLKSFKNYKLQLQQKVDSNTSYNSKSVADGTRGVESVTSKTKVKAKPTGSTASSSVTGSVSREQEQFNSFDNLDKVADAAENDGHGESDTGSSADAITSSWGNILGMGGSAGKKPTGKAAKFAV